MGTCWGSPKLPRQNSIPINSTTTDNPSAGTASTSTLTVTSTWTSDDHHPDGQIAPAANLRIFSFAELQAATRNFRPDTVLGEEVSEASTRAGSKTIHPLTLQVELSLPSKRLNSESLQEFTEWQSEVNFLGHLSHPNLVKLLGYCWEEEKLLLVYEFMQKGSLENHLFRRGSAVQPLPWDIRLKIAIGAARGLKPCLLKNFDMILLIYLCTNLITTLHLGSLVLALCFIIFF